MNLRRCRTIAAAETRSQLAGPLFWALIALLAAAIATMNPTAMIPGASGAAETSLRINSAHAIAQSFALVSFFLYNFIAALMGGLSVPQDREHRVTELLRATPLTSREYVWGKFGGVMGALLVALAMHVAILAVFLELMPGWNAGAARGPFVLAHYLAAALAFTLPATLFSTGVAFAVGTRTDQPLLVYAVPTAIFLVTVFVFNALPLHGLAPATERALMLVDPSGLRWLRQTAFALDRGPEFYNTAAVGFDASFWLGRLLVVGLPLGLVAAVARSERRAGRDGSTRRRRFGRRDASPSAATDRDGPVAVTSASAFLPPADLRAPMQAPGMWRGTLAVLGAELRELRAQPAVALFGGLILAMMIEYATTDEVAGAAVILTSGRLAVGTQTVLAFLGCLLLLFTGVEALMRERRTGLAPLVHASPLPTGALLLGKTLACGVVLTVVLLACAALGLALIAAEGVAPSRIRPFVLVWGGLLTPTFVLWMAFVVLTAVVVRHRAAAFAVGLVALAASGYHAVTGGATWATNWLLAGALRWSDLGAFELEARALLLNRLFALGLAVLLGALAVRLHERTQRDPAATRRRARPAHLWRRTRTLVPLALLPAVVAIILSLEIAAGFQGPAAAERARDYHRAHSAVWGDRTPPAVTHVDVELDLAPADRRVRVAGSYRIANHTGEPMPLLPWTLPSAREGVEWTLAGEPVRVRQRSGLWVLEPESPLPPGGTTTVGFRYRAQVPHGMPRRSGVVEQFVLPAGTVLHTLRDSFLPVPGFVPDIGSDPDAPPTGPAAPPAAPPVPRSPAAGFPHAFTTRIAVTAPSAYTVNSVGVKVSERTTADRTTVVWESAVPVRAFNVVAGRWDVRRRAGAAVFFHPGHAWNVDEILGALVAAKDRYGAWFGPYPWPELRLSEFPDRVSLAQGFATNITFSEGLGFLARDASGPSLAFEVAAHEAAHQWWGNLVTVADAPGADVLLEGMANYATLLLHEAVHGSRGRIEFATRLERRYREGRRVSTERPLLEMVDTGEPGAATVVFDKGAWALWMLHRELGRERMLAGVGEFVARHRGDGPESFPTLDEFLTSLRRRALDKVAFDAVVEQWFGRVVMPELRILRADLRQRQSGRWTIEAEVSNTGSGVVRAEVAATLGTRFPGAATEPSRDFRDARRTVRLGPGAVVAVSYDLPFRPDRLVIDPDAEVLQLARERAVRELGP